MDGGCLADREDLEDDYDVLRHLSLGEVLGIMDQLLCFEVSLPSISILHFSRALSDADTRCV